ncbi:hypothetical protein C8J57DRAFT_1229222 [Mycena rebaudengoi]|nr:hypothetical protein C8J57DRAFT_1229222 [Mycena rebaudengoi]
MPVCNISNTRQVSGAVTNELPQCFGCGNTSTRLAKEYCGSCERKNEPVLTLISPAKQIGPGAIGPAIAALPQPTGPGMPALSQIRNIGQFHCANWKDAANINNSNIKMQQSSLAITGSNMAALRNNNLATTECYAFILEPFMNLKPCDYLPTFDVTRDASVKFSELLESAIACFNSSWEEGSEAGLDRMNNTHIQIGPHFVLRDILQTILRDCGQSLDKTVPPKLRNRKFAAVYLEAHVDLDKFHARTGALPPKNLITSKKRTWSASGSISGASILKRTRLSGSSRTLKSSFVLMAPALAFKPAPASNSTLVTLFFANQISDSVTGIQTFVWNTENLIPNSVALENSPINKGRSKLVFKLTINGVAYVAKCCYNIGNGSLVSIINNRDQLINEGTTLGQAHFFLNNFKKQCEDEEVEISDFEVTDFILAREGVDGSTDPFTPSPASGIKSSDYIALPDTEKDELKTGTAIISSITWLLEPERGNVQLRKYSGTLDHPRYSDKQGATINAFQHFSYCFSNNTLVLADIQGSLPPLPAPFIQSPSANPEISVMT